MSTPKINSSDVKVSVAMITYNHEQFIAQAIESVLMQQTDFAVELVIGEDCSTDSTREIVIEYTRKYPDRIRALLPDHNLGMIPNFIATYMESHGQYIALLEGDDYWTNPHKLQKQVDFLEMNPDHAICFHRSYWLDQTTGKMENGKEPRRLTRSSYNLKDVVRGDFIPTASIMLRNGLVPELPAWFYDCPMGDWPLLVLYAQHGKLGLIDQVMSVYRIHNGSMTRVGGQWLDTVMPMFETLRTYLGPEYENQIKCGISDWFLDMARKKLNQGNQIAAKTYLLRSIMECPLNAEMRIIDKLVLFSELYFPPFYKAAKYLQACISSLLVVN